MCAPTSVCEIRDGKFTSYEIAPEQFGYERCEKGALTGGTPAENAEITKAILKLSLIHIWWRMQEPEVLHRTETSHFGV